MDCNRWYDLSASDDLPLTPEEIKVGWHFCADWDGLLVGPGMIELEFCKCNENTNLESN